MNRLFIITMLISSICSAYPALAEDKPQPQSQAPSTAKKAEVKTIFSYKDELKLTEQQVTTLKNILVDFQKYLVEKRKEMKDLYSGLKDMIKSKADLKLIRAKLDQIAQLQAAISYTDVETSRKVEETLTPSQLKKWNGIQMQEEALAKAMTGEGKKKE